MIAEVEALGGMTAAINQGLPKLRIEEAAAIRQARVDQGLDVIVGVNRYEREQADQVDVLDIDNTEVRRAQIARLEQVRRERDDVACRRALEHLTAVAAGGSRNGSSGGSGADNLLTACVEAARARATVGEMSDAMEAAFGRYQARPIW